MVEEPAPTADPDEEAMANEVVRAEWFEAPLGKVLVQTNRVAVIKTNHGTLELPVEEPGQIKPISRWLLGHNHDLEKALGPKTRKIA